MQIFEYPYVIITAFVLTFLVLAAVGIYFALKGAKTAQERTENDFVPVSKIESEFIKTGKQHLGRNILYVSISFENLHDPHLEKDIFSNIKQILFNTFSTINNSFVALYGNRGFVVLVKGGCDEPNDQISLLQEELNKCFLKYGVLNIVNVRIGAYFARGNQASFDEAIDRAKQACVLADNDNVTYIAWDSSSGKALEKKIKIENNIENEIDNNNFFLEYQPVLDAKTKKIIGAEVLSRLNSKNDGILSPKKFLFAVDSVRINEKFDYYIFEKNCKWISNNKMQREGYKYAINFSRITLSEPTFADKIISIAEKYNLNLSSLAVEILEDKNITGEARQQMINNLSRLKEKGVSILLDDFGSGYTTFDDLQNLDISVVKIDKEIIRNSTTETGFIILKNIISTSKDIGFKTLCEGIETKEQEEAAVSAGCDFLQGYYYYRPMSVSILEKILNENKEN